MASGNVSQEKHEAEVRALLLAVATMLADDRETRVGVEPQAERTEVLLARVGLSAAQIGAILGKQPGAVRMTLSRARKRSGDSGDEEPA